MALAAVPLAPPTQLPSVAGIGHRAEQAAGIGHQASMAAPSSTKCPIGPRRPVLLLPVNSIMSGRQLSAMNTAKNPTSTADIEHGGRIAALAPSSWLVWCPFLRSGLPPVRLGGAAGNV